MDSQSQMIVIKAARRPVVGWRLFENTMQAIESQLREIGTEEQITSRSAAAELDPGRSESIRVDPGRSAGRLVVVADASTFEGEPPPLHTDWVTVIHDGPPGARPTGWKVLELAKDVENLLYFEDDIELAPHALSTMLLQPVPHDVALLSYFYATGLTNGPPAFPCIERRSIDVYAWCQAIKFPRRTVAALLAAGPDCGEIFPRGDDRHGFDQSIRNALLKRRAGSEELMAAGKQRVAVFGIHWPNLVQHTGLGPLSAIPHHRNYPALSKWFAGDMSPQTDK